MHLLDSTLINIVVKQPSNQKLFGRVSDDWITSFLKWRREAWECLEALCSFSSYCLWFFNPLQIALLLLSSWWVAFLRVIRSLIGAQRSCMGWDTSQMFCLPKKSFSWSLRTPTGPSCKKWDCICSGVVAQLRRGKLKLFGSLKLEDVQGQVKGYCLMCLCS